MPAERLKFQKGDWFAVGTVVILAVAILLLFLPKNTEPAGRAEIYLNGERIKTIDLTQNQIFTVEDRYHNVICVKDGTIFVAESDCPGKDCVHSGSISTFGRILVCLPNALEIRIVSAPADADFVVG